MIKSIPVITIDGPSGVGKGKLSKKLADVLGWNLLNSGIIYRILALQTLYKNINWNNEKKLIELISRTEISFINKKNKFLIFCNKKIINDKIYTESIGNIASKISILPDIRFALLKHQYQFYSLPGLVADGRDMGTTVFPDAKIKFYLYASFQERKRRRADQLQKTGFNVNLKLLELQMKERDDRDYHRKIALLIPADNALILNSTYLSEPKIINKMWIYIKNKINIKYNKL